MEKQYKNEEEFLKMVFNEAGLEKPSSQFSVDVMKAIEARSKATVVFKPLISATGWWVLGATCLLIVLGVLLVPLQGFSVFKDYSVRDFFAFDYTFPTVELSNILLYAICFTALFLVEIPFLKRYLK